MSLQPCALPKSANWWGISRLSGKCRKIKWREDKMSFIDIREVWNPIRKNLTLLKTGNKFNFLKIQNHLDKTILVSLWNKYMNVLGRTSIHC